MSSVILLDFQLLQFPYVETADEYYVKRNVYARRAASPKECVPPSLAILCHYNVYWQIILAAALN